MSNQAYKVSDEVVCKIKDNKVVPANASIYDETIILEVLAVDEGDDEGDDDGFMLFVPQKHCLQGAVTLTNKVINENDIQPRFLESNAVYVLRNCVVRLHHRRDGMACNNCKEFFHLAESNQEDGTLVCYLCRQNPYRTYRSKND